MLTLNAVNSRYIAGYFLENDKYYAEYTVLMENSMLLSKCGHFFVTFLMTFFLEQWRDDRKVLGGV